ncbi:MAG: 2Fe-2S iron-sulfur cluster-binding protein [bacterium]|nr:2Fe-2S iron-sulfur cluster-binding protein [bacterium]
MACKTQVSDLLKDENEIRLEPLTHLGVIKDLVVDKRPYWESIHKTMPWLVREVDLPDERTAFDLGLTKLQSDQLSRSADCIKCACCYSDCPKVREAADFFGPAVSIQIYKHLFDARDRHTSQRLKYSVAPGGVFECDKHAVCIKVCPKDCRPLRAITFIQEKIGS